MSMKLAFLFTHHKKISALITLVIALIILAPLCGWLFQCGCTWPWAGLDKNCNVHLNQQHQCPWCSSFIFGYLITTLSIFVGTAVAWRGFDCLSAHLSKIPISSAAINLLMINVIVNINLGLLIFCLLSIINAWLATKVTGYDFFVFT